MGKFIARLISVIQAFFMHFHFEKRKIFDFFIVTVKKIEISRKSQLKKKKLLFF